MNNQKMLSDKVKIKSTSKLILYSFIAQPLGLILTFILPSILMVLLPFLFKPIMLNPLNHEEDISFVLKNMLPGIISVPAFVLGFLGIPIAYASLKETGMLKRLNVTGIKPSHFIFSLLIVFVTLIILSSIWLYILALIIWQNNVPKPAGGLFIIPYLLLVTISITVGITISNVSRSQASAFAMGILLFMPTLFLSGVLFSGFSGWPKYVSWFLPNTGFLNLFKISWDKNVLNFGSNSLNSSIFGSLTWFNNTGSTIYAFLYPTILASWLTILCIKEFKFE